MIKKGECRDNLYKVPQSFKAPIIEKIDSFAKSALNKADTAGLDLFAIDTLEIPRSYSYSENHIRFTCIYRIRDRR